MQPDVTLNTTYPTANGFTARVTTLDNGYIRRVSATITGDGVEYTRYYTLKGKERTDGRASPYDLIITK